jgi:peptidoglycan/LPS O-acetylase OafA/YrhL
MKRILELDGIRGAAIAMVIAWHYFSGPAGANGFAAGSLLAYLQAGCRLAWSGVDLFFVLSGFLIGGILLDSRDSPTYFRTFYTRRFFRIVPIYAAMLIVTHPLMQTLGLHQVGRWWIYPLFLQNFWMAAKNDWGLWAVTWSLAVEEQFYLTLPLIIRKINLQARIWLIVAAIAAAPLLRSLMFVFAPHHPLAPFTLMPCRADALLCGVLGAVLIRDPQWEKKLERNYIGLCAALGVLLAGAALLTKYARGEPLGAPMVCFGYTWLALLYLCVLLLAVTQPRRGLGAILRFAPLRSLGWIAYGVYLLHLIVLIALKHFLPAWPLARVSVASLAATFVLAIISWRYFEKPLIDYGHRLTVRCVEPKNLAK